MSELDGDTGRSALERFGRSGSAAANPTICSRIALRSELSSCEFELSAVTAAAFASPNARLGATEPSRTLFNEGKQGKKSI